MKTKKKKPNLQGWGEKQRRRPTSKGESNEVIGSIQKRKQGGLDKKDWKKIIL